MPQSLVYVVIINWNLKHDTAECLASVSASDYPRLRVLVVDNASTDGSPEYLQTRFPDLEVIVNPDNFGFAKAGNVGIHHALRQEADHVFLLNNDTVVETSMLSALVAEAEKADRVGIVAPKILYYHQRDTIWHLGGRIHRWLPVPATLGHNQLDDGRFSQPFEVDYVAFCAALIKRRVLDTVGMLDERFYFTYEDSDFCCRARDAGYSIVCQPQASMWHKVSRTARTDTARACYLKSKSRAMFYRLHPHGPHPWLTTAFVLASTLARSTASALHGNAAAAQSAFRGLYDGYRKDLGSP
jgi:GT2 family glycosyltransferase